MGISLTRKQLESSTTASELLILSEEITRTGQLEAAGVAKLRAWLAQNSASDLPAVAFLWQLVEPSIEQTAEQHDSLYSAIERILPAEQRALAKARRAAVQSAEKERQRQAKDAERDRVRDLKRINRPIAHFNFMVAGANHEGREKIIARDLKVNDRVYLVRQLDNPHDANAILVRLTSGLDIGYVPRDDAALMAKLIDSGALQRAFCSRILDRAKPPIPVIGADLYDARATVNEAIPHQETPEQVKAATAGCAALTLGIVACVGFIVYWAILR